MSQDLLIVAKEDPSRVHHWSAEARTRLRVIGMLDENGKITPKGIKRYHQIRPTYVTKEMSGQYYTALWCGRLAAEQFPTELQATCWVRLCEDGGRYYPTLKAATQAYLDKLS